MEIPDTRTLYPKRSKSLSLLAISVVFTLIGVAMIFDDEPIGWFPALFFGLGAIAVALDLLPNSSYLKLETEGFTFRSRFGSHSYRWPEVGRFSVGKIQGTRVIVFSFTDRHGGSKAVRKVLSVLSGHEGAIPDSYDLSLAELAELMNEYRERYGEIKTPQRTPLPDHAEPAEIDLPTSVPSKEPRGWF